MVENTIPGAAGGSSILAIWAVLQSGGWIMIPLGVLSLLSWWVILDRIWMFHLLKRQTPEFEGLAVPVLLRGDLVELRHLCVKYSTLPSAFLLQTAVDRLLSRDEKVQKHWKESVVRARTQVQRELKKNLWILGTIGSASPFIGLFGTVVGILRSFSEMAAQGTGGFAVVAAGISEALIATAAGIVVAVVAVMAFNTFQARTGAAYSKIKLQMEEWMEWLSETPEARRGDTSQQESV